MMASFIAQNEFNSDDINRTIFQRKHTKRIMKQSQ